MKRFLLFTLLCSLLFGCAAEAPETTPTPTVTEAPAAGFPETVLLDDETCTFTAKSIDPQGLFGYTVQVFLENKTDRELVFSLRRVSVNGYMCDPFFAATVSPGMKANESISFLPEELARNGIDTVTDIACTLVVYDSADIMAEPLKEEDISIYPLGKEAVRNDPRQPHPQDQVLFDRADCAMTVTGFDPDSPWGYAVEVYLENRTDKTLMFAAEKAAVNGFMCDPFWAVEVAPGKKCYTQVTWLESDFQKNGITRVETISLPVRVYDSNDWSSDALLEETFTVTP